MKYLIDQSGKIEDTAKDTVLAYSNSENFSILISKKIKRQLQEKFRVSGLTRIFIYNLFAVGVFYLIEDFKTKNHIIIDLEYEGKDKIITNVIKNLLKEYKKPEHDIYFQRIGNHPKVHYAAKNVLDKKVKPNKKLSFTQVIKALKMTDGRLRECFSTLVDAQPRSVKKSYHLQKRKSR